jgi:glycosyltransferase involved in cell wall biosynthesis
MNFYPLVSVVIPVFNASKWISETISSVLDQDYPNVEVVVIDDGSTDDSSDIINQYTNKVKYFYKSNGGQGSARNIGIQKSNGKYIAFIDADDLWAKNKLSIQVEILERTRLKWIYSDAIAFDNENKKDLFLFSQNNKQYSGDVLKPLFRSCFIPSPTPVVEKTVFSKVGMFNEHTTMRNREDWDMWLRIASLYSLAYVPKSLANYRVHSSSATGSENRNDSLKGYINVIEAASAREPKRLGSIKNSVLSKIFFSECRYYAHFEDKYLAKEMLNKAIMLRPLWLILYLYWILIPIIPYIKLHRNDINNYTIRNIFHFVFGE